jgi:hypothetical protein
MTARVILVTRTQISTKGNSTAPIASASSGNAATSVRRVSSAVEKESVEDGTMSEYN